MLRWIVRILTRSIAFQFLYWFSGNDFEFLIKKKKKRNDETKRQIRAVGFLDVLQILYDVNLPRQIEEEINVPPSLSNVRLIGAYGCRTSSVLPNNDGQSWTGGKSMGSHVSTQPVPTIDARAQVTAASPAVKARNEKQFCAMLLLEEEDELELKLVSPLGKFFSIGCSECCVSCCCGVSER